MSQDPLSKMSFGGTCLILLALACQAAPRAGQDSAERATGSTVAAPASAPVPAAAPAPTPAAPPAPVQEPAPPPAPTTTGGQEPEAPGVTQFEVKVPERPPIKLVFAHQAGEKPENLSFEERQRREILYTVASGYLNMVILETLLESETARRAAAGEYVGGDLATEDRVEDLIQKQIDIFKAQAPNGDFYRMRLVEGFAPEHYARTVKLVLRVVDMFFPRDPELWPMEQLAVIFEKDAENSNYSAIEGLWVSYKELVAQGQPTPEMPDDFTLSYVMLPGIFAWMRKDAKVETPDTGLPEGVALRVNGRDFKTSRLLEDARALISDVDEETASTLVGVLDAVERDLRAKNKWLSRATLDEFWAAERAGYDGTIFTHEQTVIEFLGFPSMEVYRQFFNARQSYRTLLPDPVTKEMMDAELATRGTFIGLGKVDADVILIGAVDKGALDVMTSPRLYKPGADPFGAAGERAKEVAQQLKDGETFDSLLLGYSDFPPRAAGGNNELQRDRGRFGALTRADLRMLLGESDYTDFLYGFSIGDDLFFHAEKDAIYGPAQGPLGWYVYRITRRDPPTSPLDPANNPRHAYQLEEDLITQSFLNYVNGLR